MSQRCCCAPFEAKVEGISHFLYGKDKLPFVHSFALNLMVLCSVCRMSCALIGTTIFGAARIFPSTARFENDDDDDDSRTQISRSNCNQFFRLRNAISTVCVCVSSSSSAASLSPSFVAQIACNVPFNAANDRARRSFARSRDVNKFCLDSTR